MGNSDRFVGPLASHLPEIESAATLQAILSRRPRGSRLPVPPATDRGVWALGSGTADQTTLRAVAAAAERDRATGWPATTAHDYARYFRDGDRTAYETAVFARQHRLSRTAVTAAALLDDPDRGDEWLWQVADGVTALCEQSSWCWPAHDDTFTRHGSVLPTMTSPFLDLGAGEVVGQLGWIDHLLGTALDEHVPGLRARIRYEARLRVLDPYLARRDWHWLGLDGHVHNWNPWIHGNLLVAALQLVDDPAEQTLLVAAILESLDRFVAVLPADGAVDEGFGYWWNGACRALEALDLLSYASDGILDGSEVPALQATVSFPHRMHLGGDWYVNVADGVARVGPRLPWRELHRAAVRADDADARRHAAAQRAPGEPVADAEAGLGRLLRAVTDDDWIGAGKASPPPAAPLVRDVWLPSVQILLARQAAASADGLCLVAKGGHNDENHNHNDVGEVLIALNGVPVVVDAGRPTYTAQTFGPDRYQLWTMRSDWHNVPEIAGTPQSAGRRFAARDVRAESGVLVSSLSLDLAGVYPRDDLRSWRRTATLDREAGQVTVTDTWELAGDDGRPASLVRYLLAGQAHQAGDACVLVDALDSAGAMVITWDPGPVNAGLSWCDLEDPVLAQVWGSRLTVLTLDLGTATAGSVTVRFREAR